MYKHLKKAAASDYFHIRLLLIKNMSNKVSNGTGVFLFFTLIC